jgi:Predicted membrane protein
MGTAHVKNPKAFNEIVPNDLGAPGFWTYASGLFEIALGVGLVMPGARTISARCVIVVVLIMWLANWDMYLNDIPFNGTL